MSEQTASAHREGPGKKGHGQIRDRSGALRRLSDFTRAPSFARNQAGFATHSVKTRAQVRLSPVGEGVEIDRIAFEPGAAVPGNDKARFQEIALAAKPDWPRSKALAAVAEIGLQARLESASQ